MAGGDDLESDDEYLDQNWHKNQQVEVDLDDYDSNPASASNKRSQSDMRGAGSENDDDDDGESSSKKKKIKSPRHLLIEAGRGIAEANADVQSAFLWTAYTHALALNGKGDDEVSDDHDNDNKFQPHQFASPKKDNEKQNPSSKSKYEKSMVTYLKSGVLPSMKRLKKWKNEKSPCVIIVCVSALRAVAILKEISSLNIRVAKLFSKHMNLMDQVNMLRENSYGIAVGTPNRLLKLFETKENGDNDDSGGEEGALCLDHTELIVIDCFEDRKKFTVCTLNDTAPDLFQFVKTAVVPQMQKRKTIKFGMF